MLDTFGTFFMEGGIGRVDKKVVDIDDNPSYSDHFTEGVIHEPLEGGGVVGKIKAHHCGFEQPFG